MVIRWTSLQGNLARVQRLRLQLFSAVQKAVQIKSWSQVRIFVEHAIGGMKRSNILVHGFRNRKEYFEDDVIGICAGLWNFILSY